MPQTPLGTMYGIRRTFAQLKAFAASIFAPTPPSTGQNTAANFDPMSSLIVSGIGGWASALGLTSGGGAGGLGSTVVKAAPGMVVRMNVLTAGTAPGSIFDTATTASTAAATASTANLVAIIPNTVGTTILEFPCLVGIMVYPGAGQQVSISYQ